MAKEKRKEFNIVDELKKDGIGPTPWDDIEGKPFKDGIIEKEALPEALRFGKEVSEATILDAVIEAPNAMLYVEVTLADGFANIGFSNINEMPLPLTVVFDETIYEVTEIIEFSGQSTAAPFSTTYYVIGNPALITGLSTTQTDNGLPFALVTNGYSAGSRWFLYVPDMDAHSIGIYANTAITTPLSDEYISENIARVADILDEGVVKQDVLPTALQFGEAATEILPETTFDCSRGEAPDDVNTVYFSSGVLIASPIQLGKTYEVCFDGERHEIKATSHMDAYTVLGDKNYSFDTYGFSVLYDEESSKVSVVMPIESTSTVKVALKAITYINSNYIKSSDRKTEMDGTNLFDATETTAVSVLNELLGLLRSNGYLSYPDE